VRDANGLVARISHLHRVAAASAPRAAAAGLNPDSVRVHALEARIAHLEELLEGLQDSVHREFLRQSKQLAELEGRIEPAVLAVTLSTRARERGL
jgi:hypothetical protein